MTADPALRRGLQQWLPAHAGLHAWRMVWCSLAGTAVCSSPVAFITIGLFMRPLSADFGWHRAEISLATAAAALTLAASTPIVGRLIDRYGVRRILIGSLLSYGLALAALPWLVARGGIYGFYFGYVLVGALSAGSNTVAYVRLLSGWFDSSRGLALGVGMAGIPIGMAVTPPYTELLIEHMGWRAGFVGLAALPLLIGIPIAVFGLREARGDVPVADTGIPASQVAHAGLTRPQAMRGPVFWMLFAVFLIIAGAMTGLELHLVPLLGDRGFTPMVAALALSFLNFIAIFARVGAGYLFDKLFAPRVGVGIFLLPLVAALMLLGTSAPVSAYLAAALIGFGIGAESDLLGYLVGRYFGLQSFAEIYGWLFGAFMLGTATGPYLFGLGYDTHGNYAAPLIGAAICFALGCMLLALMPRYPRFELA
ncbi:MAG: MFS transporter [Steroidobacteraceae bacterium]